MTCALACGSVAVFNSAARTQTVTLVPLPFVRCIVDSWPEAGRRKSRYRHISIGHMPEEQSAVERISRTDEDLQLLAKE